jgi:hypothetical protein
MGRYTGRFVLLLAAVMTAEKLAIASLSHVDYKSALHQTLCSDNDRK